MTRRGKRASGEPVRAVVAGGAAVPVRPSGGFAGPSWLPLLVVLLVGVVVRLLAWRWQPYVAVDGSSYIALARTLFTGDIFQTQQPPGYPFLIRLLLPYVPDGGAPEGGVVAARVVALVCGVGLLVPFYGLARRVLGGGRWAALGVTLVLALTPLAIRYSVTTTSEATYLLGLVSALLALAAGRDFVGGLLLGASFLVRPEGLVVALGVALARLFGATLGAGERGESSAVARRRPPLRPTLLLLLGVLLAGVIPMLLFNHAATGEWQLSRKGGNLRSETLAANEPTPAETISGRRAVPLGNRLVENLGDIARNWPARAVTQVVNLAGGVGWVAVLALGGLFAGGSWLLGATLLPLLVAPLFLGVPMEPRFVFPLVPFVLLIAGRMVERLPRALRPLGVGLLVVAWLAAAVPGALDLKRHEGESYPELVVVGRALRNLTTPSTIFFDRKPFTAYYAGGRSQTQPLGPYMESIDAMQSAGGDYLVLHAFVTKTFRPDLLPLLQDPCVMLRDPRVTLIYLDAAVPNRAVAVYRFNRPGLPPVPAEIFGDLWRSVAEAPCDSTRTDLHRRLATLRAPR